MSDGRTVKKIPPEVLYNTRSRLDELIDVFEPYHVVLAPDERRSFGNMDVEFIKFLELSYGLAVECPRLFPAFMDREVFKEEFFTTSQLWMLINRINQLRDNIWDTEMLLGSRTIEIAVAFYKIVKMAARHDIPGAKVIFEELKPVFPSVNRRRRKPKAEEDDRQLYLFADSA